VVGAGLFIKLNDTGADGFVPISSLGSEYFVYSDVQHSLTGQRTGETYQLGDQVEVKLLEVTPVSGGLRFEMISEGREGKPPAQRHTRLSKQTPKSRKKR
jgi:ribonuclease R